MSGGITIILTGWYLWKRKHGYVGPKVIMDASDDVVKGVVLTLEELRVLREGRRNSIPDGERIGVVGGRKISVVAGGDAARRRFSSVNPAL